MQVHFEFNQPDLGHGATDTVMHPVVMVALAVTILLMFLRPRKYAIVPLLLCAFLVPRAEEVYLFGAHLYVRIILVLVGFIRVAMGRFQLAGGFTGVDALFTVWVFFRVMAATITNWPGGTAEQMAFLVQAFCGYFLLRYLIVNEDDIVRATKALAVISLLLGATMIYEYAFRVNLFGTYIGGAPIIPIVRNGTGRAQATFGHSILAGCFGATLLPLFIWLWSKKSRVLATIGIAGSTLMVFTTSSSTPVLAYVAGILGLLFWPIRRYMRLVRWALVLTIVGLAMVMKAPVWYVMGHINVIGGSGGWDRAFLIDTCVNHFKDWWLIGTNQNAGWGFDMWDLSDQFVAEAETGGLFTFICFVAMICWCYSRLGNMRKRADAKKQWLLWCLGAVMLAHIFAYFGVSYWDQTQIWWFAFLAMIMAMTAPLNSTVAQETATLSKVVTNNRFGKVAQAWGYQPALPTSDRKSRWSGPWSSK